jgi:hypothetical protein
MKTWKYIGLGALVLGLCAVSLKIGPSPHPIRIGFVSPAEAVVGRPLTPVSVAGVARRTARRCAVGVYNC